MCVPASIQLSGNVHLEAEVARDAVLGIRLVSRECECESWYHVWIRLCNSHHQMPSKTQYAVVLPKKMPVSVREPRKDHNVQDYDIVVDFRVTCER